MGQLLLLLVVALTVAAVVFGVTVLVTGRDPGLAPVEPDGRAVPLPGGRPLAEPDIGGVRFDTALRGYRMDQVDQAMRRAAYDIGYKSELIEVLEAEVDALRDGRAAEAEKLRETRLSAAATATPVTPDATGETATGETATDVPGKTATVDGDAPAASETAAPADAASEPAAPASVASEPAAPKVAADGLTVRRPVAEPAGDPVEPAGDATEPAGDPAEPAGDATERAGKASSPGAGVVAGSEPA
ncbi:DivIVA domain-containing protein [Micromonospora sp. WMMD882]|uniref:DivIVA domain-containing protein n=1 Tax=Micromonospora sp. WMMD882 TaxID=3015151 RepID=UPI00248C877D|nr:DivIVA domain-containing protein [Micromonospora sp. WMMD882]WBB77670.1 DivIVA domain-containing protein [Micromonospora sp. WMMD882]